MATNAINSLSSSGQYINIDALVQNAVRVQQQRLTTLQSQKSSTDTQISTLGKAKSQIASLEDKFSAIAKALGNYKVTGAPDSLNVTSSTNGNYTIAVNSLASSQIITMKNSSASGALGYSGTLQINAGSYDNANSFTTTKAGAEISVDESDTLANIAKKINDSDSGVTAAIINGADGQHLSLSNSNTGATNAFQITSNDSGNSGLSALNYQQGSTSSYNNIQEAKDGVAIVNGLTINSANNNFTVNTGLTFIASDVSASKNISVKRDDTGLSKAISEFATAYNATTSALKGMDVDNSLKNFTNQLRTTLGNTDSSNTIFNLGLNFDKNGTLSLDETKFKAYANSNSEGLTQLVNKQFGATSAGMKLFKNEVEVEGVIDNKINTLTAQNKKLTNTIGTNQDLLKSQIATYQAQFAKLDQYLSQLNDNSNSVTQLIKQFSTTA